jgi:hypothetical protein
MAAPYTSLDDIPSLHAGLLKTFYSGKTQSVKWRKDQLKHLAYLVKDNEYDLSGDSQLGSYTHGSIC